MYDVVDEAGLGDESRLASREVEVDETGEDISGDDGGEEMVIVGVDCLFGGVDMALAVCLDVGDDSSDLAVLRSSSAIASTGRRDKAAIVRFLRSVYL